MKRRYHRHVVPIKAKQPHVITLFQYMDRCIITIDQASMKSGVAKAVISNWRNGKSVPRLDLFIAVCNSVSLQLSIQEAYKQLEMKL